MKKLKKYILKPGTHQFAPGSPAVHTNDNLTDEEAEWYLENFPHIARLFEKSEAIKPLGCDALPNQNELVSNASTEDIEPTVHQ